MINQINLFGDDCITIWSQGQAKHSKEPLNLVMKYVVKESIMSVV